MNILFITANRLGDAVLSTGILGTLIDRYPGAQITIACGPLAASLFTEIPQVVRVIELVKKPRHGHWWSLWLQTVGTHWDLIVDLRNTLVSRLLRTHTMKIFKGLKPRQHMVEGLASLLNADPKDAGPRLWLNSAALEQVAGAIPRQVPLLALAPGAHGFGKRWPKERYAELATRLLAPNGVLAGGRLVVLGAPGERGEADPSIAALPADSVIDLVGRTDPLLAAAWLARADLYVGNDSGLTHLAAAVGAPTLALFGPGIPARYRPWGASATYLIANDDPNRTIDMCKIDDMLALAEMEKLSVDQVVAAAEASYMLGCAA
ncbi:MAG: rfaF [Rhodospirillales bacterium]|nr:rfaF [Rhodospirillales bacterium]